MSTSTCTTYNATRSSSPASSPFYAAECAFERLTTGSDPLTLDGALLGEPFPAKRLTLDAVRGIVLKRSNQIGPRDRVWAELVRNARTHGGDWTIAAVGMALPALKWLGGAYAKKYEGHLDVLHVQIGLKASETEQVVARLFCPGALGLRIWHRTAGSQLGAGICLQLLGEERFGDLVASTLVDWAIRGLLEAQLFTLAGPDLADQCRRHSLFGCGF